mmetsp:Transcript_67370/g.195100  ORF Transcript_67370/g.195100 Transcript_67370/m.195100 type:complete len:204 (-) Transcript_67370:239-850(-)
MPAKTLTSTASEAMVSGVALSPKSNSACATTGLRPVSKLSKMFCGESSPWRCKESRYFAVAPLIAPHWVWPRNTTSFTPRAFTLNSKLPTRLPSAFDSVLPALRHTNRSPGCASKRSSTGARESAHPMMEAMGFCPYAASASKFFGDQSLKVSAVPLTNLLFPSTSLCSASPAGTRSSSAVRTPYWYFFGGICPAVALRLDTR